MQFRKLQSTKTSANARVAALVIGATGLLYALYLGLYGLPFQIVVKGDGGQPAHYSAQPWVFGLAFAGVLAVFCVGVASRIQVMVGTALLILTVGSVLLFTSFGPHFAVITAVLAALTHYNAAKSEDR